jgi:hypothetical protein
MHDESHIPASAGEWYELLSQLETETSESYLKKPANLVKDYRAEKAMSRDYEGRELLELLQNAADQAQDACVAGKVIIQVKKEGLLVGNTGTPFSIGGIESIENAHLSPKRFNKQHYIGNKGLGFRSVLNWTDSPIISSGQLSVAYCRSLLASKLEELKDRNFDLKRRVEKEPSAESELVIPVLAYPGFARNRDLLNILTDSASRLLCESCESLRQEGYDTVIGMPFSSPGLYEKVCSEILNLQPEILLFVRNIAELVFDLPNQDTRTWSVEGDAETAMVLENEEPLGIWQVFSKEGVVPEEYLESEEAAPTRYQVTVAVPERQNGDELASTCLYSYFPTAISVPLPVVCHATLELEQNRNHLASVRSNSFVLKWLQEHLACTAERRAEKYPSGINGGFRVTKPLGDFPADLDRAGVDGEKFLRGLIAAVSSKRVVPTLDGGVVEPAHAFLVPSASVDWLPSHIFPDVVSVEDDEDEAFFAELGVKELDVDELRERITSAPAIGTIERAKLIKGLIDHCPRSVRSSSLLVAREGAAIPDGVRVFIQPKNIPIPEMPHWVNLWFLNQEFQTALMESLDSEDARDLSGALRSFGLAEYSLSALISRVVAEANRYKKKHQAHSGLVNRELIRLLYDMYASESDREKIPRFPERSALEPLASDDSFQPVTSLYFSTGYGTRGNLVQELYGGWAPEKLVASIDKLGLSNAEDTGKFLSWLGVNEWPLDSRRDDLSNAKFQAAVLDSITYPSQFGNYQIRNKEDLGRVSVAKVASLDGLEKILQHADPGAISLWIALDSRSRDWGYPSGDHLTLSTIKGQDVNPREYFGVTPGYIAWKIGTTTWLLDKERNPLAPRACFLGGERLIDSFFSKPAFPSTKWLSTFGASKSDIKEGWRKAGVTTSLSDLDIDAIYRMVLELPTKDKEGKSARSLYKWLLDAPQTALEDRGIVAEAFLAEGEVWAQHQGKKVYVPVSEAVHADSEGLPEELLDSLKIVDLPYRVGSEKVKRILGIDSIDRMDISQRVVYSKELNDLDFELQRAKPFFYLLRSSQTGQARHLGLLKKLQLKICSELEAEMEYREQKIRFEVPLWASVIDDNSLYVRCDSSDRVESSNEFLSDSVGAAMASMFRLADGGEFARIFACRDSHREQLLQRMRGELTMEELLDARQAFSTSVNIDLLPDYKDEIKDPEEIDEPPIDSSTIDDGEVDKEPASVGSGEGSEENSEPSKLKVEEVDHEKKGPAKRRPLVVKKRKGGSGGARKDGQRPADGDFAERKCMEFEEADHPKRYPLRVGQIMGYEGAGCDILSFATQQDSDKFASGEDRDPDKVVRFIEAKGRGAKAAEIELRGNEKDAANRYADRYYIYRLYQCDDGSFELSVLQNPVSDDAALEQSLYVHLDRAEDTKRYELIGGSKPD